MSEFEHFINICEKNGLSSENVRDFLEYQILSDFYITNTDRHFNNFGVLRNPDTLEFIGLAPIYDSGNSMFWDMGMIPQDLYHINISSFKSTEVKMLSYVTKKDLFDIDKLPSDEYVYSLYSKDPTISDERIHALISTLKQKKEMLYDFATGKSLNSETEKGTLFNHKHGRKR